MNVSHGPGPVRGELLTPRADVSDVSCYGTPRSGPWLFPRYLKRKPRR